MDEWMMDVWMDGLMDEWMMDVWMDGCVDNGWMMEDAANQHIRMISIGSYDTEAWSYDAEVSFASQE